MVDWEHKQWLVLSLVFGWVEGKTLAICCCVSKQWLRIGKQEEFWKELCLARWPSSGSEAGLTVVKGVGGHRKYYALRSEAQACLSVPRRKLQLPEPKLRMEDLSIFLDVVYQDLTVFSLVKDGEELQPCFTVPHSTQGMFRFSLDIPKVQSACVLNRSFACDLATKDLTGNLGREEAWKKEQVKEFQISWAIMEKSSHKILQLLQVKSGKMVGNTCTFSDWLPFHSCCPSGETSHIGEVDIVCQSMASPTGQHLDTSMEEPLILRQLRFGLIIANAWRYFSQMQALRYLHHVFHHDVYD